MHPSFDLADDHLVDRVERLVEQSDAVSRRTGKPGSQGCKEAPRELVNRLLADIYTHWRDDHDFDPMTECSSTSDAFRHDEDLETSRTNRDHLNEKDIEELCDIKSDLQHRVTQISQRLIRQLKSRDRLLARTKKNCDVITAILQATSLKRRIDSKLRFSIKPACPSTPSPASQVPGKNGRVSSSSADHPDTTDPASTASLDTYDQWRGAMAAVAKLSNGIPPEFRKKVWLSLADHFLSDINIDWEKTKRFAFNERSNPDDSKLGIQIVKDLHRTGCQGFNGDNSENERACLKRVLLAYARWNKRVGYCQGFNIIAALILDVVDRCEEDALKVMIYLIDSVLPERYFVDNLRSLSVDMAVFRQLLKAQLPRFSAHLDRLQADSTDLNTGANYEPPLTNVFTMQWFLTMFGTCLKKETALRVWDCILLDGVDTLIRVAIAIWAKLKKQINKVNSADEFYTMMGKLSQDLTGSDIIDGDDLIKTMYNMKPNLFDNIAELRERYTYNITPFSNNVTDKGARSSDESDEFDEDAAIQTITCFSGIFPNINNNKAIAYNNKVSTPSLADCSLESFDHVPVQPVAPVVTERMTLDLSMLRKQYHRLRLRQSQAHVISSGGTVNGRSIQANITIKSPSPENHLFTKTPVNNGKQGKRNRTIAAAPQLLISYPMSDPLNAQLNFSTTPIKTQTSNSASDDANECCSNYSSGCLNNAYTPDSPPRHTYSISSSCDFATDPSTATCHSRRYSSITSDISSTSSRPDTCDDLCDYEDEDESSFSRELLNAATPTFDDDTDASSTCSTVLRPPFDDQPRSADYYYRTDSRLSASTPSLTDDDTPLGSPRDTPTLLEVARGVVRPIDKRVMEDESRRKKDLKSQESEVYEKAKQSLSQQKSRLFDPFPCRQQNRFRSRNVMKLGMYRQNIVPPVKTGILID